MQDAHTIVRQPILFGLLASIVVHAAMWHSRSIWTPPVPHMETGRTAIQLTLLPSPAGLESDSRIPKPSLSMTEQNTPTANEKVLTDHATGQQSNPLPPRTETQQGITTSAVMKSAFHPPYPRISRQRGEEGTVLLKIQVLSDGTAGSVEILRSSGYPRLDRAAVTAAGKTVYTPAMLLGKTVESDIEFSYTYRLTDD